jgi:hypothetical protein
MRRDAMFFEIGSQVFARLFCNRRDESTFATFDSTDRVWEDVLLTNVIAFDVRVFDSQALALTSTTSPSPSGIPA